MTEVTEFTRSNGATEDERSRAWSGKAVRLRREAARTGAKGGSHKPIALFLRLMRTASRSSVRRPAPQAARRTASVRLRCSVAPCKTVSSVRSVSVPPRSTRRGRPSRTLRSTTAGA